MIAPLPSKGAGEYDAKSVRWQRHCGAKKRNDVANADGFRQKQPSKKSYCCRNQTATI
jgi:hypothetical protein